MIVPFVSALSNYLTEASIAFNRFTYEIASFSHLIGMKNILAVFIALISVFSISVHAHNLFPDKPKRSYVHVKSKVDSLKHSCRKMSLKKSGELFSRYIDEKIVPHWIGTPWDYNGVTQKPGEGKIACGYFVTTVLRDAGVKINRVKMAQCASETMINSLTKVKVNYSALSFDNFIAKVKAKGKGLSIIGLDNHTGFLYNDGLELWFIHSSYVGTGAVAKEKANDNLILKHSKYKVVGFISHDANFMKRWML